MIGQPAHEIDPFDILTCQELRALAGFADQRSYRRGERIEGPSRQEGGIFVVEHGSVRTYVREPNEDERTVAYRHAGQAFELDAFDETVAGEVRAEAVVTTTLVHSLPWARFLDIATIAHAPGLSEGDIQALRHVPLLAKLADERLRSLDRQLRCQREGIGGHSMNDEMHPRTRDDLATNIGTKTGEGLKTPRDFKTVGHISYLHPRSTYLGQRRTARKSYAPKRRTQ